MLTEEILETQTGQSSAEFGRRAGFGGRRLAGGFGRRLRARPTRFRPRGRLVPFVQALPFPVDDRPVTDSADAPVDQADPARDTGAADQRASEYTRWLHLALRDSLAIDLPVTSRITSATRRAIRLFQRDRGLVVDGVVGPDTERALITARRNLNTRQARPDSPVQTEVAIGAPAARTTRRRVKTVHVCEGASLIPVFAADSQEDLAYRLTRYLETENTHGSVVSAVDGISLGMMQWNLKAGTLQGLLARFVRSGGRLETHFGNETVVLNSLIALPKQSAVDRAKAEGLAMRWALPFCSLMRDPVFVRLLQTDIRARMTRAMRATRVLGFKTVRGLALMFDIEVGDGLNTRGQVGGKVERFAQAIAARESALGGRTLTERERLATVAEAALAFVGPHVRADREARRRVIASGTGQYRNADCDTNRGFAALDRALK